MKRLRDDCWRLDSSLAVQLLAKQLIDIDSRKRLNISRFSSHPSSPSIRDYYFSKLFFFEENVIQYEQRLEEEVTLLTSVVLDLDLRAKTRLQGELAGRKCQGTLTERWMLALGRRVRSHPDV